MAKSYAKPIPKVPKPRAKPSGFGMFSHVSSPRHPALKSRIYTKDVLRADPTEFTSSGFGDTGLSGES